MNVQPVPTQYRNTVFRSKSEAVFARALDLSPLKLRWWYEPDHHASHNWDFEVLRPQYDHCCECGAYPLRCEKCSAPYASTARWVLLEFKPAEPTTQYVDNLTEKARPVVESAKTRMDSYVVWGSPWNGPVGISPCSWIMYPIFASNGSFGWGDFIQRADNAEQYLYSSRHLIGDILGITEEIAQEARRFRFDLKIAV